MGVPFVLVIVVFSLVARHPWQPKSAQCVQVETASHTQAVVTLITHDGTTGFRPKDAVDFPAVIALFG